MKRQKLIILSGSPCVGKSAVADLLYQSYENSAYLDGDWCWCVNPFSVQDPRLRNGDKSMSFVLSNYLQSAFDYVFFASVVVMFEDIRKPILHDISATDFNVIGVTLTCSEDTLRERHRRRGDANDVSFDWLHLPPYPGDHVVSTDGKTPQEVADEVRRLLDAAGKPTA